jgi:hypothetical protein
MTFIMLSLGTIVVQIIGVVLGIIGLTKKNKGKKHSILGLIMNSTVFIVIILFILFPFMLGYKAYKSNYVPDNQEIMQRFSEFLVDPRNLQGIEAYREGKFLFKYYSNTEDFFEKLEQQALSKGWQKQNTDNSTVEFSRVNHEKRKEKIILYKYELIRVSHNKDSGLVCVGYDYILSLDELSDIKKTVDAKALELTTWRLLDCCISGKM